MSAADPLPPYQFGEELANSITHGLGTLLALAGLAVLTVFAVRHGQAAHVAVSTVFGLALVLCFTTSTLYHAIPHERVRHMLRAFDHSAIFVLIAGTYTPFMAINLAGPLGWSMLAAIWAAAVAGIALRLVLKGRRHGVVVACYLAMGWSALLVLRPLIASVARGGLVLIVAGGLAYTIGVGFYRWRSLPYGHAIWHVFVLAGSAAHFFAVLYYVLPPTAAIVPA